MTYRVVFDVHDRLPDIAIGLGAAALATCFAILVLGRVSAALALGPLAAGAGTGLVLAEAWGDQDPTFILFAVVGLVLTIGILGRRQADAGLTRLRPRAAIAMFPLLLAAILGLSGFGALHLGDELAAGHASVIEGQVVIYVDAGPGRTECISVAQHDFCDGATLIPGFSHTRSLGGPLREGWRCGFT